MLAETTEREVSSLCLPDYYIYTLKIALLLLLICSRFLICCEIRYNFREMAAGQAHALFSVKTSLF